MKVTGNEDEEEYKRGSGKGGEETGRRAEEKKMNVDEMLTKNYVGKQKNGEEKDAVRKKGKTEKKMRCRGT